MTGSLAPFRLLLITVPGWIIQQIEYLKEENYVLRECAEDIKRIASDLRGGRNEKLIGTFIGTLVVAGGEIR